MLVLKCTRACAVPWPAKCNTLQRRVHELVIRGATRSLYYVSDTVEHFATALHSVSAVGGSGDGG